MYNIFTIKIKKIIKHFFKSPIKTNSFSESKLVFNFFKKYFDSKLMLDVGAHFGESFLPYEQQDWEILAFEPDSENRSKINSSSSKTKVFDYALSEDDNPKLSFYTSKISSGISSLSPFHSSHVYSCFVNCKSLRTVCSEHQISRIDFLKIDTEGYDLFVLKGFPFENIQPIIILCEFEDFKTKQLGYNYHDMGSYLLSKGYKVFISEWFPIVKYGTTHRWRLIAEYPFDLIDCKGWGNFIAVRSDYYQFFLNFKNEYILRFKSN